MAWEYRKIGYNLSDILKEKKIDGKNAQEYFGFSPQTLSKYLHWDCEKNDRFDLNVVLSICRVCNADPIPVIFTPDEILQSAATLSADKIDSEYIDERYLSAIKAYTGLSVEDLKLLHKLSSEKKDLVSDLINGLSKLK